MSQKINPKSLRLGISNLWLIQSQQYGKKYQNNFFLKYIKSFNYTMKNLVQNTKFANKIEFWHNTNKFHIKIYVFGNQLKNTYDNFLKKYIYIIAYWFYLQKYIKVSIYSNKIKFLSSTLFSLYIDYLTKNLNYTPKKILAIILFLIKQKINTQQILFTKNGPKKVVLKGYKITLNGRFENSKSNMAKKVTFKNGFVTLTSMNNNIDFINKNIYTKLGTCNLKIWLFYKLT